MGVNYDILRKYVEFLERKGYAAVCPGKVETVRLTPEGQSLRRELAAWIERFMGGGALTK